jgi:hypothetical protein
METRILATLLALAALVGSVILMADGYLSQAQTTAILFVGFVIAVGRPSRIG